MLRPRKHPQLQTSRPMLASPSPPLQPLCIYVSSIVSIVLTFPLLTLVDRLLPLSYVHCGNHSRYWILHLSEGFLFPTLVAMSRGKSMMPSGSTVDARHRTMERGEIKLQYCDVLHVLCRGDTAFTNKSGIRHR